jgi:hypothetical protein
MPSLFIPRHKCRQPPPPLPPPPSKSSKALFDDNDHDHDEDPLLRLQKGSKEKKTSILLSPLLCGRRPKAPLKGISEVVVEEEDNDDDNDDEDEDDNEMSEESSVDESDYESEDDDDVDDVDDVDDDVEKCSSVWSSIEQTPSPSPSPSPTPSPPQVSSPFATSAGSSSATVDRMTMKRVLTNATSKMKRRTTTGTNSVHNKTAREDTKSPKTKDYALMESFCSEESDDGTATTVPLENSRNYSYTTAGTETETETERTCQRQDKDGSDERSPRPASNTSSESTTDSQYHDMMIMKDLVQFTFQHDEEGEYFDVQFPDDEYKQASFVESSPSSSVTSTRRNPPARRVSSLSSEEKGQESTHADHDDKDIRWQIQQQRVALQQRQVIQQQRQARRTQTEEKQYTQELRRNIESTHQHILELEAMLEKERTKRDEYIDQYLEIKEERHHRTLLEKVQQLHLDILFHSYVNGTPTTKGMILNALVPTDYDGNSTATTGTDGGTLQRYSLLDKVLFMAKQQQCQRNGNNSSSNNNNNNGVDGDTIRKHNIYQDKSIEELHVIKNRLQSILDLFLMASTPTSTSQQQQQQQQHHHHQADIMKQDATSKYILYSEYGQI